MTLKYIKRTWLMKIGWRVKEMTKEVADEKTAIAVAKALREEDDTLNQYSDFELHDGGKLIKQL